MSKVAKVVLITAIVMVVVGLGVAVTGAVIIKKNGGIGGENYTKKEMVITDSFKNVVVDEVSSNVVFKPSQDGQVRIEYFDSDRHTHQIEVSGDTLKIFYKDNNILPWWMQIDFGNWWNSSEVEIVTTVYLPAGDYGSLDIDTVSGDVNIPSDFSFNSASFNTVSGDVSALCKLSGAVKASTTSGNVTAAGINGTGVDVNTVSGEVSITDASVNGVVDIDTTSGDVTLTKVVSGTTKVSTTSGDIKVTEVNADSISISTTSGDVKGTVVGDHEYDTDTVSGDITIPSNIKGMPMIDIDTVSGDIELASAA